jgi:PAS domain S-box-containing protein
MLDMKRTLDSRTALVLGAWVAYALAFIPLYHLVGTPVAAVGILPVVAVGGLFGMRAGLFASLLAFSLNMLLMNLGGAGWDVMIRGGLLGSILLVLIGAPVGRLRDMGEQVKQELAKRKRVEEALHRAHDELEMQVQERTADLAQANEALRAEIAERKAVEEALRVKDSALASSINAIVISDLDKNLTYVNPSFLNLWGYDDDKEVLGRPTVEFWQMDEKVAGVLEALGYMKGWIRELVAMRKDGSLFDVQLAESMVTDEAGKPICMMGSFVDITERKRAEEALKEYSERLEEMVEERTKELRDAQEALIHQEKLAVLGQLAGGVGHELRNPLGAISNAVYFLNMVLEEPEPEVKETLEILNQEVAASERIISSLLDFARAKPPTRRKVELSAVIQEALARVAVPENVEVVNQLDGELPIMLADPGQLGQVFGNIILNAVQAMSEGGRLVVKSEVPTPEWVAVSFADTGVGIPEENLGKLFEPLFTTKAKGVGLGLAVSKTLVEGHRGTIEVESEAGAGTTFTVRLPISSS